MTRDEIYDHLAQVYLGKRKQADDKKKKQFSAWLVINITITLIIFSSSFYGLTAFLTRRGSALQSSIIYSLHNGPIRIEYNFNTPFPPVKSFNLSIPALDVTKYSKLHFTVRAKDEGGPNILKVVVRNEKNETAFYYVRGVNMQWNDLSLALTDFHQITDWTKIKDVSFVLESWNVDKQQGSILIDDISFSNGS